MPNSLLIQIIFKQIFWLIDETVTTTPDESEPGSNGNERVLYTFHISIWLERENLLTLPIYKYSGMWHNNSFESYHLTTFVDIIIIIICLYIYLLDIYDFLKNSLLLTFLNKPAFICLHTVKWFQVLLFNISDFIYQVFLSNLILIICLHSLMISSIINTNNPV